MSKEKLEAAYALETPDDNRDLYGKWAQAYDADMIDNLDYQLPWHVARMLKEKWEPGSGTDVLDVGAGTGLVGKYLSDFGLRLHGVDISSEMLEVAAERNHYAQLTKADLTHPLDFEDGIFDAVVSAGTFTHGHLGPDVIDELFRVGRSGALFVLSVNTIHYGDLGFAAKFQSLAPMLRDLEITKKPIYGAAAHPNHAADHANLVSFFKA